jgi:ABC-2 type transport system permease protein
MTIFSGRPAAKAASRLRRTVLAAAAGMAAALTASGCTSTHLTPARLESSLSRTFANLYVFQQSQLGNPPVTAAGLDSRASCQKGGSLALTQEGSGVWLCQVTYLMVGRGYRMTARYNVVVQTDGCYAADGDGPVSVNGAPTITGPGDRRLVNPLALIDGCFDTS